MNTFSTLKNNVRSKSLLGSFMLCLLGGMSQPQAGFDPVNDDTDIFLANPNVPAQRPNILLFIDNTANWSTAFANEKSALVGVIDSLTDQYNVGTMLFPETGGANDSVDGGYLRMGIRQMSDATTPNKTTLKNIYNLFDVNADKGNNATPSLGMGEVYRYFSGGKSRASHGKVKSDYAANATHEAVTANLGDHPLPASPSSNSNYTSPIAHECQKNFLIYISNGNPGENNSSLATAQSELETAKGSTLTSSDIISITPNGQQGSWMDEWAAFMASTDLNGSATSGEPHLTTYVVEVDPVTTGQGPSTTALMKSTAKQGNGRYFSVTSGSGGAAITEALNSIFTEIQAVNSVFASTTLPVSVNVRGTNLNQVYIGVFRPDSNKAPRWFGNLKLYKLDFDTSLQQLVLVDATPMATENPNTGFILDESVSFWTEDETPDFWAYRDTENENNGIDSDLPDGSLVEKGGAAQQLRKAYATDQSIRNLYTCTGATCPTTSGTALSLTPFAVSNSDITNASLGLGTVAVSSISAAVSQTLTTVSDTKTVASLSTSGSSKTITSLTNLPNTAQAVTSISTTNSKSITAIDDGLTESTFTALQRGGSDKPTAYATTASAHGFTNLDYVRITGNTNADYNGTYQITVTSTTQFNYTPIPGTDLSNNNSSSYYASAKVTNTNTTVTVTSAAHGLTSGNLVTIAGVVPASYNGNNNSVTVTGTNTFTYETATTLNPITSFAGATIASTATTNAIVTLTGHGYADGSTVTIAGATQTAYNDTFVITVINANSFSITLGSVQPDATGTITATQGGTTVTANFAAAHGYTHGNTATISGGSPNAFNGSFVISCTAADCTGKTAFTYTAIAAAPNTGTTLRASSGVSTTVAASVPGHGFGTTGTVNVKVGGITSVSTGGTSTATAVYDNGGSAILATIVDADNLTYNTNNAAGGFTAGPAVGTEITMRLSTPTAFVTKTAHGYATNDVLTITGATPTSYNLSDVSVTVLDVDNFKYPLNVGLTAAQGTATGTITANKKTTTATARAVNHGFSTGNVVNISGATPSAFNTVTTATDFTITKTSDDTFTYTLPSAQLDASGTIVAAYGSGSATERANIIDWVRGEDNLEDENTNSSTTDVRASIHSDVLHSRPAVVNYNRHGNDNDVYIYYGTNDGVFHATKGGFAQSTTGQKLPGQEEWGFIPKEFFNSLQRMRNNEPLISSTNKKPYFADGSLGVYVNDTNGDDKLDPAGSSGDQVYLYISMRRGGRFIYALDVTDPANPKLLWTKSNADTGYAELGYTWSAPNITNVPASTNPVMVIGAGHDPSVEDIDPENITSFGTVTADGFDSNTVTVTGPATYTRSMGRGIFVLDATDGSIIWQAGPGRRTGDGSHPYLTVADMDYAIPSDVVVIKDSNGSSGTDDNRAYVGDTGGNVWRVDMADADVNKWTVTKLASVADTSSIPGGLRKFLFPPDVVYNGDDGYDAVLIGSGDREHPFDDVVINRMYMFKDTGTTTRATVDQTVDRITTFTVPEATLNATNAVTIGEGTLFDATDNCIDAGNTCGTTAQQTAVTNLASATGWYITLLTGEKLVGNAVTINNVTFFNTNQPSTVASSGSCSSDLGVARQYKILFTDATPLLDQNQDGDSTSTDRHVVHPGGGYLPSPVPVVVETDDGKIHEGIISGVSVDEPPGTLLNARTRKFWFKEME